MKNKKGFTLVELMAVIAILAIIIAIAVPVFNKTSKNAEKKNYENTVSLIESAAAKYFEENNITTMYVNDLIKDGYLEADKDGNLYSPKDNSKKLNCYIIQIHSKDGQFYPKFINKDYEENGTCSYNKLNEINNFVNIKMTDIANATISSTTNYWTKNDVILELNIIDNEYKNSIVQIDWYEGNQAIPIEGMSVKFDNPTSISSVDNKYLKYVKSIEDNTSYYENIKVKILIDIDGEVVPIQSEVEVKIDKTDPQFMNVDENNSEYLNGEGWTPELNKWSIDKYYSIKVLDQDSNFYGYKIVNTTDNCPINGYEMGSEAYFNQSASSTGITKKLCVSDYAGNIASKYIVVKNIDTTKPTCTLTVSGTKGNLVSGVQWYKSDTTVTLSVNNASLSGMNIGLTTDSSKKDKPTKQILAGSSGSLSDTIKSNIASVTYYGVVTTGAGQKADCQPQTFAVEKGITPPTVAGYLNNSFTQVGVYFNTPKPYSGFASQNCYYNNNLAASSSGNLCYINSGYVVNTTNYTFKKQITSLAGNTATSVTATSSLIGICTDTEEVDTVTCQGKNGSCASGTGLANITTNYVAELNNAQVCSTSTQTNVCLEECHVQKKDTTKPKIKITPNGKSGWAKSRTVKFRVKDNSGKIKIIRYKLSTSTTCSYTSDNASTWNKATTAAFNQYKKVTVSGSAGKANDYYLLVYAKDNAGNERCKASNAFYIDRKAPTASCSQHSNGNSNSICLAGGIELKWYTKCDFKDAHSGLGLRNVNWGGAYEKTYNNGALNNAYGDIGGKSSHTDTLCTRSSSWSTSGTICDKLSNCTNFRD